MRLLSAIIAFTICALFGYMKAYRISARERVLCDMLYDLRQLSLQMEFTSLPLAALIKRMQKKLPNVWDKLLLYITEGDNVNSSWEKTKALCGSDELLGSLNKEDLALLDDFFKTLGSGNLRSETKKLSMIHEQINVQISELEKTAKKRERVYRSVGILTGAAALLLII